MSLGFPRDNRITHGPDLQRMLKEGKRIRTRFLEVRVNASPLAHPTIRRIGVIVPKARHTAVERNQLKRRLKELGRTVLLPESGALDVVLIARGDTYRATFQELQEDVERVKRAFPSSNRADTE